MTVWFVIPAARLSAFRALYLAEGVRGRDNQDEDEGIGQMIPGVTGNLMTGTTRMSHAARQGLEGRLPPWLQMFTTFPPTSAWERGPGL